jgi:hypothetical protein
VNEEVELSPQERGLSNVMGSYRYVMTPFESEAWTKIIDAVSADRFLAFISHHYATSTFAPKPSDATKYLDLMVNPDVAYAKLERLVQSTGPYVEPDLAGDPILIATILNMGGWVSVNEKMPDRSETFLVRQFRERFDACFTEALVQVRINNQLPAERLVPIGQTPLSLAARPAQPALAAPQARVPSSAAPSRSERFK